MIYLIKKYLKYIITFFVCIIAFTSIYAYTKDKKEVNTNSVKKLSITKAEKIKESKTDDKEKTVFVDVKGAVNMPGVYELNDGKRIIDAINMAGGLADNANTININLSKKLTDEMYIVIYTKNEIANYKKTSSGKIECASNECVCPDTNNDGCIKKSTTKSSDKTSSNKETNGKVSINTASKEELMTLSGIGEAKAEKIISYRNENGLFNALEDIKNVSGIGDALFEKIKDNITL